MESGYPKLGGIHKNQPARLQLCCSPLTYSYLLHASLCNQPLINRPLMAWKTIIGVMQGNCKEQSLVQFLFKQPMRPHINLDKSISHTVLSFKIGRLAWWLVFFVEYNTPVQFLPADFFGTEWQFQQDVFLGLKLSLKQGFEFSFCILKEHLKLLTYISELRMYKCILILGDIVSLLVVYPAIRIHLEGGADSVENRRFKSFRLVPEKVAVLVHWPY